jgi:hypothetical protein
MKMQILVYLSSHLVLNQTEHSDTKEKNEKVLTVL